MPDGSRVITLIDQFNAALRQAGIQTNSFGEKYSLYSLRHFYAVTALRNGIGVFEIARNMGTSVQMIQEYYGKQATPAAFATSLGD
jgi:integrase